MEPANEETGRIPRPQPLPASPPDPLPAFSSASDHDTLPAASHSTNSSPASSQSPNHSPKQRPVSGIVPPYWSHQRNASRTSQISIDGGPAITLEDHTEDPNCETSRGLWAKSVTIDDHVVVEGKTGIGAYVVWNCRIRALEGGIITVRMRYPRETPYSYDRMLIFHIIGTPSLTTYERNWWLLFRMRRMRCRRYRRKVSSSNSGLNSSIHAGSVSSTS
ncbi:hypothetical protein BJY00DRAFT_116189 [Aspergillus carlsbadensis]|nr:hypothetical protein BJY00DRAFT_116189 [Aspergillus carlsbadensis]